MRKKEKEEIAWKELTLARYKSIPNKYRLSVGSWNGSILDAIKEIEKDTYVGKFLVSVEKEFLTSLKEGRLTE